PPPPTPPPPTPPPTPKQVKLVISINSYSGASILSSPAGISCRGGATGCSATFNEGQRVRLNFPPAIVLSGITSTFLRATCNGKVYTTPNIDLTLQETV